MKTRRRAERMSAVVRATLRELATLDDPTLDDEAFFARLAERVATAVGASKAAVSVIEGRLLQTRGRYGFPGDVEGGLTVRLSEEEAGLAERIVFGDEIFIGDVGREGEFERYRAGLDAIGVRNAVAASWRTAGSILGAIVAYDSTRPSGFDETDGLVLELAANVSAFAFQHRRDRKRTARLLRLTDELSRLSEFDAMARATAAASREIFPGVECGIVEIERGRPEMMRRVDPTNVITDAIPDETLAEGTAAGAVVATGEPIETDDLEGFSVHGAALRAAGFKRARCLPLTVGGPLPDGRRALGAITFMGQSGKPFSADDRELMDDIARRLGVVAHRAELVHLEAEQAAGLRAALSAAIDVGSSLDPADVMTRLLRRATEALDADRGTLSSIEGDELVIRASHAVDATAFEIGSRFHYRTSPQFMRVIESRQPLFEAYRLEGVEEAARAAMVGFRHAVTVPIVESSDVVAAVTVSRRTDRPFTAADAGLLEVVTAAAGIALENARLFEQTARDRRSLRVALEAAEDVAAAVDPHEVTAKLVDDVRRAASASDAVLGHLEDGVVVVDYATPGLDAGMRWRLADGVRAELEGGRPAQVTDPQSRWGVTIPLVVEGQVVGVMALGRPGNEFTQDDIDSVLRLAPIAALLLRNARLLEEARQANRAKSEFLNMAGHELRTPLAVIRGYLSLISTGAYGDVPPDWAGALRMLEAKGLELSEMVESILAAARIQSGRLPVRPREVDMVGLAKAAVERANSAAALSGGAVAGRYPEQEVVVRGDPTQLAVILDNLLANAVKYSPRPAVVTVTVHARADQAEIRVTDRGRGIPRGDWERIFAEFERIESFDRDYPPGTGLGLYIARQLAERYGGTLKLEWSEPGRGSAFLLSLPMV